jgi:methionine aminotransferase
MSMRIDTKLPKVGTTIFTVMSQLAAEHKAVNLGQGFPDFDAPEFLQAALARAMRAGRNQYAPMTGIPALRQQIAAKTERLYRSKVDAETEITVTSGATEALFAAIHAVVRAGEEVIVLDPCYDSYEPAIELAGARAVHVPLVAPADLERVPCRLAARARCDHAAHAHADDQFAAQSHRRGALARRPATPGRAPAQYRHRAAFGRGLRAHRVRRCRTPERAAPSRTGRAQLRGEFQFGKTYHCTGWKLGYCIAPAALSAEFRKVHQYLTFCSFSPAQWAFAEMIERHPEHYLDLPAFYQEKRDRFRSLLADTRFALPRVDGAYFQLADYSSISDLDDVAFSRWLTVEKGVAAIPLSPFYQSPPPGQRLIRFCFAKSDATQVAAVERLRRV